MQELIKVSTNHKGTPVVSARDLHVFLEVDTPFRLWHERMFEYGFVENVDYAPYKFVHPQNKQETIDFSLTLDCAKEISMIQRSEKGKQARQYFLECEKKAKSPIALPSTKELALMVVKAEEEKELLQKQIDIDAPKVLFANSVTASSDSILIAGLAKLLKQNGIDIGQNRLFEWMRYNHYLGSKGEYYNEPTQKSMDLGLFEVVVRTSQDPKRTMPFRTTKVTGKGQVYFINRFLKDQKAA